MKRTRNDSPDPAEQVRTRDRGEPVENAPGPLYVPTGCMLLNLALSDHPRRGYGTGKIVNIPGDSFSGKTLLAFTMLAECSLIPAFDEYRYIHDDAEAASEFNIQSMFGATVAQRLEPPRRGPGGEPLASVSVEDFQCNVFEAITDGRPFIYIMDSFDAISDEEEMSRAKEMVTARRTGKEMKGSYGAKKARNASIMLRQVCRELERTQSLLVILSQTRDNFDPMSPLKRTRSGGRALKFYSSYEVWTSCGKKHKSHERVVGFQCIAKVTKNKQTGKIRDVEFPIYTGYGVDDIGGCVDWLVEEGVWRKSGMKLVGLNGEAYIRDKWLHILDEQPALLKELRMLVWTKWREIEKSVQVDRRPRYE